MTGFTEQLRVNTLEIQTANGWTSVPCPEVKRLFTREAKAVPGDVNGDGDVDIADAVCIVNHVVGKPNTTFIEAAADANGQMTLFSADGASRLISVAIASGEDKIGFFEVSDKLTEIDAFGLIGEAVKKGCIFVANDIKAYIDAGVSGYTEYPNMIAVCAFGADGRNRTVINGLRNRHITFVLRQHGAGGRIRTPDLRLTRSLL